MSPFTNVKVKNVKMLYRKTCCIFSRISNEENQGLGRWQQRVDRLAWCCHLGDYAGTRGHSSGVGVNGGSLCRMSILRI